MNKFFGSVLVCLLISASIASGSELKPTKPKAGELCPGCIEFMSNAINQLLNIIANVGVLGSCQDLCGQLPNQIEFLACDLLCDYVGIEGFIDAINSTDPDPVWICMEIDVCPSNDHAAGNIASLAISPSSGPVGTNFTFTIKYSIINETGTGDLSLVIVPADGSDPIEGDEWLILTPPGNYMAGFSLQAEPSEGDPFNPGKYAVYAILCEGDCGCEHSHCFTMSQKTGMFTITGSQ